MLLSLRDKILKVRRCRLAPTICATALILTAIVPVSAFGAGVTLGRLAEPDAGRLEADHPTPRDSTPSVAGIGALPLLSGPIDPETYVLGPGDVLSLDRGLTAGASQVLTVDAEGVLYIPDLGRHMVAHHTLAVARREILEELKRFLPRAPLELRLLRPRAFKVFLVGETGNPGAVAATAANRAVEALSERGGLLKTASLRNIELHRTNGTVERVDLQSFLALGDQEHNPYLNDGDRIVVPRIRDQMLLSGGVQHTGFFELAPGDSLGGLVRLAGGLSPDATADSVLVTRFRDALRSDSSWVSLPRDGRTPLGPDDRVFVRRRAPWHPLATVFVEGEAMRPGEFPILEGRDRLSDLLSWMGGFTPNASRASVVLVRDPQSTILDDPDLDRLRRLTRAEMTEAEYHDLKMRTEGRRAYYELDLAAGLQPGAQADVLLRPGDRLIVSSTANTVRVGGEVRRPGLIGFKPGLDPEDYVDLAGGYAPRADRSSLRVIRSGDGQALPAREVDRLSPGDFIWVPDKTPGTPAWTVFKDIIAVTAEVATVILVITSNRSSSTTGN